ncbi:MAG: hypothetical protein DMG49_07155, partial [Acidobacteria bacterium]
MSRIHDALKKAAEERASQSPASSPQTFVDVTEEISRSAQTGNGLDTAPKNGSAKAGKQPFARFEQLLKRCAHPKWTLDPRMSVFGGTDSKKIGAEPFRTLRSRLSQIAGTHVLKRIVITSSVPAEGKTFVAANLAQSIIRQPDRRVLLIDADLRASRLHVALGAPSTPGLTDYLRGEVDEYAIIQSSPDEKLCFIPGGNEVSNPSELLLSDRMRHLLDVVTPMFDFVILDSPPATPVHDPSVLADLCDGVLFVVRA